MLDIDIYYNEIVHSLYTSTLNCIPRVPRSALKHYWSAALDDLKADRPLIYGFCVVNLVMALCLILRKMLNTNTNWQYAMQ
jgi:hypothetical protein